MARLSKAARGKFRWIGVKADLNFNSRNELINIISEIMGHNGWKLYDIRNLDESCFFILRIKLEDYSNSLESLNSYEKFQTLTSSGKIKLIRERIF